MNELTDPDYVLCKDLCCDSSVDIEVDLSHFNKIVILSAKVSERLFDQEIPIKSFSYNHLELVSLFSRSTTLFIIINDGSFPGFIFATIRSIIDKINPKEIDIFTASSAASTDPIFVDGVLLNEQHENSVFCWSNDPVNHAISSGNLPFIASFGPVIYSLYTKISVKVFCELFHENPFILKDQIIKLL